MSAAGSPITIFLSGVPGCAVCVFVCVCVCGCVHTHGSKLLTVRPAVAAYMYNATRQHGLLDVRVAAALPCRAHTLVCAVHGDVSMRACLALCFAVTLWLGLLGRYMQKHTTCDFCL
jgi:hypothetical protein